MAPKKLIPTSLPDGIYIRLPEDVYHNDTALGSTDLRNLLKGPGTFWRRSKLNPKLRPWKTEATVMGSAIHKFLLEGREEFDRFYIRGPWGEDDDDLSASEKGQLTKAAKAKLLEGQELIPRDDYDFILDLHGVFQRDAELRDALSNSLNEVSIFYTRRGVRMKVRFDILKLYGFGDLKSIANEKERDIVRACSLDIKDKGYFIQVEHYLEGRSFLPKLAVEDKIFIADVHYKAAMKKATKPEAAAISKMIDFINKVAAQESFAAQLIFIPKPPNAPDAWATIFSRGHSWLVTARSLIEHALDTYEEALKRWPPEKGEQWYTPRPITEFPAEENYMPTDNVFSF